MIVVSNSSTLMALARIGLFNLLKDIFNIVFIPNAVYDEVVKNGEELPGAKEFLESDWIKVCSVKENESVSSMRNFLDPGESEAIALALETNADWIIIDEKLAREYSRNPVKLNVIGTLGILLIAKERGLISDISSQLDKLSASGFRISRHVYREVLKKACEFKGFIATREVNNESQLWNILNSNPRSFTIHEDIKSIEFIKGVPPIENIKEKGRSFSEDIEIQWQKLDTKFRIVAFAENKNYLNSLDISNKSFDVECVSYMLWGGYKPDIKLDPDKYTFIEVRIPKYLEYPIPAKKDERLYIEAYHYIEDGVVLFTRYLNIVLKA